MDNIVTLKSKTGTIKFPKTVGSAVILTDGKTIQEFATNISDSMELHNHNDLYYLKDEVYSLITHTISDMGITSTYTKSEINTFLNSKASIIHSHNDLYYTKTEVNAKIEEAIAALNLTADQQNTNTEDNLAE